MNILEDVINKIKQFFSRNKTKLLPVGKELTQYGEENLVTQETKVYSAKEALKQNWVLGEKERLTNELIEKESNEAREIFSNFIDSKFEYDIPLQRAAIIVEQSSDISDIIGSYIETKIVTNRLDYNNIDIHSDEIISFIKYLEGIDFSRKLNDNEWYLETMKEIEDGKYGAKKEIFEEFSTVINPEYREFFESLTDDQKKYFIIEEKSVLKLLDGMSFEQLKAISKMSIKNLNLFVSLNSEEQEFFKHLSPQQLDVISTLDASQLHAFMVLGESSKSRLIEKGIQDPTYLREMLRAISIYMKRPHENVEYNMYKKFLSTEERRQISRNPIRYGKTFFR